jgi:protease-4
VIMETMHAEDLLKKVGAKFETIKSGEFKDSGSPYRAMNPKERAVFQAAINDVWDQFITAVAEGRHDPVAAVLAKKRGIDPKKVTDSDVKAYVKNLADGRIYTGRQAQALGLVDSLGGLDDAIDRAADLAGIDDPEVITLREQRSFAEMLTGMNKSDWKALAHSALSVDSPGLKFLYR